MVYFETNGYFYGVIESVFYLFEIIVALASIIYAICFLCRPGMSKKVLKLIIYRHVCYIGINILC